MLINWVPIYLSTVAVVLEWDKINSEALMISDTDADTIYSRDSARIVPLRRQCNLLYEPTLASLAPMYHTYLVPYLGEALLGVARLN